METSNPTSFWQKKEGVTGKFIMAGLIGGALILFYNILPKLINFVNGIGDLITGIIRIGLLAFGAVVLYLIISSLKDGFMKLLENVSWWITDFIIGLDPITTMKTDIKNMVTRKNDFDMSASKVYGRVIKLEERESTNTKEALRQLKMADIAKAKGDSVNAQVAANQAARLKSSNDQMRPILEKLKLYYKKLQSVSGALDFFIKDKSNLVATLEEQYMAIKDSVDAMRNADKTLGAGDDEASMFNRAVKIAQDEMARGMGYIDMVMNNSQELIDKVDLEKGLLDASGTELLNKFESGEFDNIISELNRQSSLDTIKVQVQNQSNEKVSKFNNLYS